MSNFKYTTDGRKTEQAEDNDNIPQGNRMAVELAREDDSILRAIVEGEYGYMNTVKERAEEKWGEENMPSRTALYKGAYKVRDLFEDGLLSYSDEKTSVAQLSAAEATVGQDVPPSDTERVKAVLGEDEMIPADPHYSLLTDIRERVREEYGPLYSLTEERVEEVLEGLRDSGFLDEVEEEHEPVEGPAAIRYRCALCGKEAKAKKSIQYHISNEDDSRHRDRTGGESQLVEEIGEPAEQPHPAFEDEGVQEALDDGFDVFWTIYTSPDATQDEIADILGMSVTTLRDRVDKLGIDWKNREEDVCAIIDDLWETEDEEAAERGIVVSFPEQEVRDLLTGKDASAAKERLLIALMDSD